MTARARLARHWRSITFRSGLTAAVVMGLMASLLLVALVFVVYAVLIVGTIEVSLVDEAERQLLSGTQPGDLELDVGLLPDLDGGAPTVDERQFWAVLDEDGKVLQSSGEFEQAVIDADLTEPFVEVSPAEPSVDTVTGVKTIDGQGEWFVQERLVQTSDDTVYRVVTAVQGTFSFGAFFRASLKWIVPTTLILATVAGVITSFMTRRALRRVEKIRAEVDMISQRSLHRRVPIVDAADGINRLAITMNDMLQRLETASQQQSQFLADASHELRSPVAGLLAQLEVAASYPDRVDAATLLPKLHAEAHRLHGLVNDLLLLSRSDAGTPLAAAPTPVMIPVTELLSEELEHQRLVGDGIQPTVGRSCEASVVGSKEDLRRALRNLVDNAVRHGETAVTIDADHVAGEVIISISDDGPGVATDDAARIFDRFVRLDEARSRDAGGAGLGLAIAREIAQRHGGEISLVATERSGATFQLRLPAQHVTKAVRNQVQSS